MRRCYILMTSYWSALWYFTRLFVWQCVVTTKAMYLRKHVALNQVRNMSLEKYSKNATMWHLQYLKIVSFEVLKVWELDKNDIWSWLVVWFRDRNDYAQIQKGKKYVFACHTVALGIDSWRSAQKSICHPYKLVSW